MSKFFVGCVFLALLAAMAYGMGIYRNGSGAIAAHTAVSANHRDSGSVYMVAGIENYKSVQVRIKLFKPDTSRFPTGHKPAATADTGSIRLVTYMGNKRFYLDSMGAKALLPCSLTVSHAGTTAGADTLLKQILAFEYQIADTISDTAINYNVDYEWEVIAKE